MQRREPLPVAAPGTPSSPTGEHGAGHLAPTTVEQAIAAYVQEMRACWARSQNPAVASDLAGGLAALFVEAVPSHGRVRTPTRGLPASLGDRPSYRAVGSNRGDANRQHSCGLHAFGARVLQLAGSAGVCVRNALSEARCLRAQRGLPQSVEPEAFVHLLRACQLPGSPRRTQRGHDGAQPRHPLALAGHGAASVSELCGLRLTDVDRVGGTVTVHGKGGQIPHHPLVGGRAARRVRLSGAGSTHADLGARAARGAGSALAHRTAEASDQE